MKQTPIQKAIDNIWNIDLLQLNDFSKTIIEKELRKLLPYEEETIIGFADKLLEMPNRELESFTTKEHFNQTFKK